MLIDSPNKPLSAQHTAAYKRKINLNQVNPNVLPNGQVLQLAELVSIAKLAGDAILEIYNSNFSVDFKKDQSPLTYADIQSNEIICQYLSQKFPDIKIISEENKTIDYKMRCSDSLVWLVDPLDGTKEFIKKNGQFTVNVGLSFQGSPILGIVHIPVQNITYFSYLNCGAYKYNHENGEMTPIHVSTFSESERNLRIVSSASHMNTKTQAFISQFENPLLQSAGSSLKLLMVAEGQADIYPRLAPTSEWDTCAAHAILKEAGGSCLQAETSSEVVYNKENILNPDFICYGHRLENSEK